MRQSLLCDFCTLQLPDHHLGAFSPRGCKLPDAGAGLERKSLAKCEEILRAPTQTCLKHSSSRPDVSYSLLKAFQNGVNAPRGRHVYFSALFRATSTQNDWLWTSGGRRGQRRHPRHRDALCPIGGEGHRVMGPGHVCGVLHLGQRTTDYTTCSIIYCVKKVAYTMYIVCLPCIACIMYIMEPHSLWGPFGAPGAAQSGFHGPATGKRKTWHRHRRKRTHTKGYQARIWSEATCTTL